MQDHATAAHVWPPSVVLSSFPETRAKPTLGDSHLVGRIPQDRDYFVKMGGDEGRHAADLFANQMYDLGHVFIGEFVDDRHVRPPCHSECPRLRARPGFAIRSGNRDVPISDCALPGSAPRLVQGYAR